MGIFEWLFVGFLTTFGGVTLFTEPTDISIDEIYVAGEFEELGLTEETALGLLNLKVTDLQAEAGISPLDSHALRLNYKDSALARFADDLGVMEHVDNLHALFDLVDHRMTISIYSSKETENEYRDVIEELTADIHLLETRSGRMIRSVRLTSDGDLLPLLDEIAEQIIKIASPSAHALRLFATEIPDSHREMLILNKPVPAGTFSGTQSFIEEWLVVHGTGSFEQVGAKQTHAYLRRQMILRAGMWNLLGLVHMAEGRLDDAGKSFMKSIHLNDEHSSAYVNMGAVLGLQGNYEAALSYLRKAYSLEDQVPITYLYAAAVLWKQEKPDQALKVLEKLEAMPKGSGISDLYKLKALIYAEMGRSQEEIDRMHRKKEIAKLKNPYQFGQLAH